MRPECGSAGLNTKSAELDASSVSPRLLISEPPVSVKQRVGLVLERNVEVEKGSDQAPVADHVGRGKRIPSARSDCGPVSSAQALMQDGSILRAAHSREMGQIVGLTPFQLIGLFKRAIGLTPHAYLTQVRLKAAIREMWHGASIAEAALSVGFYNQSALMNHFKHAYGITRLQWVPAASV
jgi:AraC-like DNA-binding protein